MKRGKQFITLEQAKKLSKLQIYKPIPKIQKVIGYGLLGVGLITLPLPTGSVLIIMLGCLLLGINYKEVILKANYLIKERLTDIKTSKLMRRLK